MRRDDSNQGGQPEGDPGAQVDIDELCNQLARNLAHVVPKVVDLAQPIVFSELSRDLSTEDNEVERLAIEGSIHHAAVILTRAHNEDKRPIPDQDEEAGRNGAEHVDPVDLILADVRQRLAHDLVDQQDRDGDCAKHHELRDAAVDKHDPATVITCEAQRNALNRVDCDHEHQEIDEECPKHRRVDRILEGQPEEGPTAFVIRVVGLNGISGDLGGVVRHSCAGACTCSALPT
mmetsp:Transcript_35791/g.93992  ORF Transcript_35791/g.93992 Transcript_35791/m.93992 type:complete len:233 (-) Transcript_35791:14-712(-)